MEIIATISFGDWNAAAPEDPYSYGVTIFRR